MACELLTAPLRGLIVIAFTPLFIFQQESIINYFNNTYFTHSYIVLESQRVLSNNLLTFTGVLYIQFGLKANPKGKMYIGRVTCIIIS